MPTETDPQRGTVLDPGWEEALVRAADAEGEQGSLDADLAVVRLLLHARAPERLDAPALDRVWGEVDGAISPTPWWRRRWVVFGVPIMVGAAAALVLVLRPTEPRPSDPREDALVADSRNSGMKDALEAQFALLEPGARAAVERDVERGRGQLRGELLASAMRQGSGSIGGAP